MIRIGRLPGWGNMWLRFKTYFHPDKEQAGIRMTLYAVLHIAKTLPKDYPLLRFNCYMFLASKKMDFPLPYAWYIYGATIDFPSLNIMFNKIGWYADGPDMDVMTMMIGEENRRERDASKNIVD